MKRRNNAMMILKKRGFRIDMYDNDSTWVSDHTEFRVILEVKNGDLTINSIEPISGNWDDEEDYKDWEEWMSSRVLNDRCLSHPDADEDELRLVHIEDILDLPDFDWRWGYDR
jgi:hypothetical protein